jgi:hypothetical protein
LGEHVADVALRAIELTIDARLAAFAIEAIALAAIAVALARRGAGTASLGEADSHQNETHRAKRPSKPHPYEGTTRDGEAAVEWRPP